MHDARATEDWNNEGLQATLADHSNLTVGG